MPELASLAVRSTGPTNAQIMVVGEAPGEQEVVRGEPFVGASGAELSRMLQEAGILRSECFLTNVCRVRPPGNDIEAFIAKSKSAITPDMLSLGGKWVKPPIADGVELLRREIELVKPNVIIALGNLALWALTGNWGVTNWRGSLLACTLVEGPKVVPTYHPAAVLRQWSWRAVMVHDLRRAAEGRHDRTITRPEYDFIIRPSFALALETINHHLSRAEAGPIRLSVDIETRAGHIACIGFSWDKLHAICIPLMCAERPEGYWPEEEEVSLMLALQSLLTHPNVEVIGQNFLYDAQYFWRHLRYKPRVAFDTMLAQHVAFAGTPKSLDYLASLYCEHYRYWKDDGKVWNKGIGEEALWSYNCEDCVRTFEVAEVLEETIAQLGLDEVHTFQQFLFWPVLEAMIAGVRIDTRNRGQFALQLSDELARREQWFIDVLGHPLNPKSPKQLQRLFYEDFKLPSQRNRKTGNVTLDDEALRRLAQKEPLVAPITRKIAECRSLGVFLSTFINAPLDSDGRMRCSFNITGTETYRFSSSENAFGSGTNLQNIPKGGVDEASDLELPNVRSLFIPDPGMTMFDTDLASADLRVVVWEADEGEMKRMLADGLDPYTEVAREFYRDKTITKKDAKRQKFKSFCHGTNYLGSPRGLAMRLGISVAEAERTQAWYFQRFPRIRQWQEEKVKAQLRTHHFVQNGFGYRRFYFDRIDDDVFRQAAAWIPQSSVAIYINNIWVRWCTALPQIQLLLQVHDSLVGQFPTHLRDWLIAQMLEEASKVVIPYTDPLVIPLGVKTSAKSWGDCQ
ncbi:MAG: DNA polymerase [Siphoviridae sp. ctdEk19]|nr:MAG: DNA polymerase [Siphoviridae sp. ctdEk19]